MADFSSVLITGANSGLGAALARQLAGPSVTMHLFARDTERLAAIKAEIDDGSAAVWTTSLDLRDRAALTEAVLRADARAPVDLVIANAGIGGPRVVAGLAGEDPDAVDELVTVSLGGAANTVTPLLPLMVERRRGAVVFVGSIAGVAGLPQSPMYSAVKAALAVYGDALSSLLSGTGVSVMVAQPGFIDTPMGEGLEVPRPGLMTAEQAASIIIRQLKRGRRRVTFPMSLGAITRLAGLMPPATRKKVTAFAEALGGTRKG